MTNVAEANSRAGASQGSGSSSVDSKILGSSSADRSSTLPWVAITLCFFAVLLDGLDTSSIGVAAPAIAANFMVSPASLTPAFVLTSVGAVL